MEKGSGSLYPLRPELIESTYLQYRSTGDHSWLAAGLSFFESLERTTRVNCGYAAVQDVTTLQLSDEMPSFFLSETCKYLYLLFDVNNFVHNRSYIMTTEAHLFDASQIYRIELGNNQSSVPFRDEGRIKAGSSARGGEEGLSGDKFVEQVEQPGRSSSVDSVSRRARKRVLDRIKQQQMSERQRRRDLRRGDVGYSGGSSGGVLWGYEPVEEMNKDLISLLAQTANHINKNDPSGKANSVGNHPEKLDDGFMEDGHMFLGRPKVDMLPQSCPVTRWWESNLYSHRPLYALQRASDPSSAHPSRKGVDDSAASGRKRSSLEGGTMALKR